MWRRPSSPLNHVAITGLASACGKRRSEIYPLMIQTDVMIANTKKGGPLRPPFQVSSRLP
jgi:hypothetical protein